MGGQLVVDILITPFRPSDARLLESFDERKSPHVNNRVFGRCERSPEAHVCACARHLLCCSRSAFTCSANALRAATSPPSELSRRSAASHACTQCERERERESGDDKSTAARKENIEGHTRLTSIKAARASRSLPKARVTLNRTALLRSSKQESEHENSAKEGALALHATAASAPALHVFDVPIAVRHSTQSERRSHRANSCLTANNCASRPLMDRRPHALGSPARQIWRL